MGKTLKSEAFLRKWPLATLAAISDDLLGNLSFFDHSVLRRVMFDAFDQPIDYAIDTNIEEMRKQLVKCYELGDFPEVLDELDMICVWEEVFIDSVPGEYETFCEDLHEAMDSYYREGAGCYREVPNYGTR